MKVREMIKALEQLNPELELFVIDSWNEVQIASKPILAYCNEDDFNTSIDDGCWDYCVGDSSDEEGITKFYVFEDL